MHILGIADVWEGVVEKYANMQIRNQIIFFPLNPAGPLEEPSIENSAKSIYEYGFRAPGMLINCWLEKRAISYEHNIHQSDPSIPL